MFEAGVYAAVANRVIGQYPLAGCLKPRGAIALGESKESPSRTETIDTFLLE
jgi:hypothetical protein